MADMLGHIVPNARGWWVNGNIGSSLISTQNTPNSASADLIYPDPLWCQTAGQNAPLQNLPCTSGTTDWTLHHVAARSRHPGGVNVLLGDGSVRFVTQNVDATTWRNLGFRNDGLVLGDF